MKRGNLGDFSHLPQKRPAQMKLSSMYTPTSSASPSRNPPLVPPPHFSRLSLTSALFACTHQLHLSLRCIPAASISLCHIFFLSHMLICFSVLSLFHYHYLRVFPPSSLKLVPSFPGSIDGGRMRCFNESVLSSSLEGGQ